jgi:5'-nucleotidase / UDP-sugar diphosphatase
LIEELRSESVQAGNDYVTVHGGDAVTGTLYYSTFRGVADAAFMNQIGFDAMVIGNHEFDDGDSGLADFAKVLNNPILSYNCKCACI